MRMPRIFGALVLSGLIVSVASAGRTQDTAKSILNSLKSVPTDSVSARTAAHIADIRADLLQIEAYHGKLATASSEDSLVLRLQMFASQQAVMDKLHRLADDLVNIEKDTPRPELRRDVVAAFDRTTPRVWGYIGELRAEIDRMRARRVHAAPAARPALEDRISRVTRDLDAVYRIGAEHLAKRAELGIAVPADTVAFDTLLDERAEELSGRMNLTLERMADLNARLKESPGDADTKALLAAERRSLKNETTSMAALLPLRDEMGLDSADYRAEMLLATKDVTTGLTDPRVAARLARQALNSLVAWVRGHGPAILVKILLFIGILLLFRALARMVSSTVERAVERRADVSVLLRRTVVKTAHTLVMALGLVIALGQVGIDVAPLLAGLGVAGFIIGFALQDTLSNFASGLMILIYRPYDVGDVVDVTGAVGKVEKMSLVNTNITTFDNQMIVMPNSKIWGDVIKNVTHQTLRRVDMVFGISYADDIPKAEQVLDEIIRQHEKVLPDPAPVIKLHKLNESSVDFIVRPWVKRDDYWDVYWDVTREVKMRFDREGISIPFPQRDVHLHQVS